MITRDKALSLIKGKCDFSLQRHLSHVASAMESLHTYLNISPADLDRWYLVGLLHDIDWNETINDPSKHCGEETAEFLSEQGVPLEWIMDIRSHTDLQNIPRDSDIRKALVAVDELSGFCVAVALMRPTKMLGMKSKSISKKIKDKHFARNVSREDMHACKEYFNLELNQLLDEVMLPAFEKIAPDWQLA